MSDAVVGDLYVWCRPDFVNAVSDMLGWLYSGMPIQVSQVLGLKMFCVSTVVPHGDVLYSLNALLTYGNGAITFSWFAPLYEG